MQKLQAGRPQRYLKRLTQLRITVHQMKPAIKRKPQLQQSADIDRALSRESWKIFQIMAEFVEGFQKLASISPSVSVFGSARFAPDHKYSVLIEEISRKLSDAGFAVVSGGGPGIMAVSYTHLTLPTTPYV